jgi:hypothetical protein
MISRVLCTAILLIATVTANAQENLKQRCGGILGLGVGFGYDNVRGDPGVPGQVVLSGLADVTIGSGTFANCRIGYSTASRGKFGDVELNEAAFFWKNVSLAGAVFHRLSTIGALGVGVGLDWIKFTRNELIQGPGSDYDAAGNKIETPMYGPYVGWKSVAPTCSALWSAEFVMQQGARITVQGYLKFSFAGRPRGAEQLYLVQTTGLTIAFMRDLNQ